MATPSFVTVGTRTAAVGVATISPALPASRVNGNLLIAFVEAHSAGAARVFTWPSDWTVITRSVNVTQVNFSIAYRYVDGTETAPAITWTGNIDVQSQCVQYTGVHPTNPIGYWHKALRNDTNTTTSWVASAMTTQQAGSRGVLIVTTSANQTAPTPTGFTSRSAAAGSGGSLGIFDIDMTAQGNTNAIAATFGTTCKYLSIIIELTSGKGIGKPRPSQGSEFLVRKDNTTSSLAMTGVYTSTPDDILVAVIYNAKTSATTVSSVSGGSLTWNLAVQKRVSGASGAEADLEVWWARAEALVDNATVTATLNQNTDSSFMCMWAVSGADVDQPFDSGGDITKFNYYNSNDGTGGSTTTQITGVTTTRPNTIEYCIFASWDNNSTAVAPTGFTTCANPQNVAGTLFAMGNFGLIHNIAVQSSTRALQTLTSTTKWQMLDFAIIGTRIPKPSTVLMGG